MKIQTEIEPIKTVLVKDVETIELPPLNDHEKETINPIVPPTSGIRMEIYEKRGDLYYMTATAQYMFFRVFKAVAEIAKTEIKKQQPSVLLVSDDRPSASRLTEFCSKIFAHDGYKIYYQLAVDERAKIQAKNDPYYSRMGTPYSSSSLALIPGIDLVVCLTASHNDLVWNGVKIYIELAMPISGQVMEAISKCALEYTQIQLASSISPIYIDADSKNNEYIIDLVSRLIDLSVLKGKKIALWPYLGHAPEIQDLFRRVGVDLYAIDDEQEPPNPTAHIHEAKLQKIMTEKGIQTTVLLDADRDRVVFYLKNKKTQKFISLTPNELYTAMHNILAKEMKRPLINVRTVPSDPRCDLAADLNFITGVGYKHLGIIIYAALGKEIDPQKFQTAILYQLTPTGYEKIMKPEAIPEIIANSNMRGTNIAMVLWEESGGHTFNLIDIEDKNGKTRIKEVIPAIGDKYPAAAILVLCALIEQGYDIIESVDQSIIGTRTTIKAEDEKKVRIVEHFAKKKGEEFEVGEYGYQIGTFEQVDGVIDIILLKSKTTEIYFRPSGTGPEVRIYVYGPANSAQEELNLIKQKIMELFP